MIFWPELFCTKMIMEKRKSSEIDFELRNINIKLILEYSKDLETQILKMENYLKDYGFRSVIKDDSISRKF